MSITMSTYGVSSLLGVESSEIKTISFSFSSEIMSSGAYTFVMTYSSEMMRWALAIYFYMFRMIMLRM